MNKNKKIKLLIFTIITIYLIISLLPVNLKVVHNQNEFITKFEQVEKIIPKTLGEYKIEDSKLLEDNRNYKILNGVKEGIWYRTENGIFGNIEYENKCIQRKRIGDKITIKNGKCNVIDEPLLASNKIKKESSKEQLIRGDENETKYDYSSKEYFVGANPNNYLVFENKCWRIVNITKNNDIKLVYENEVNKDGTCENITTNISGNIGVYTWDYRKDEDGNWNELSSLHDIMYYWEKDKEINNLTFKMDLKSSKIKEADWYVGSVSENNTSIDGVENDEKTDVSKAKIGMLNSSDYLKVSCSNRDNIKEDCMNDNYLMKEKYHWWTINSVSDEFKKVWIVMQNGELKSIPVLKSHEFYFSGVRLSIYLDGQIKLIGFGTEREPYRLIEV